MTELEVMIVFFTTLFFTLLYLLKKEVMYGFFVFPMWWIMGLVWLLIDPTGTSSAWSISWVFHAIGWVFLILVMAQIYDMWRLKRRGYEESELD